MDTDLLAAVHRGDLPTLHQDVDGRLRADARPPSALLCGSFHPLHVGHRQLAAVAASRLSLHLHFEIGLLNADKPALTVEELRRRLEQFVGVGPVWITRTPTFAAKARLFPGVTFVVGADTAERILSPRFYGGSMDAMLAALADIRTAGCQFLVAGRAGRTGAFVPADGVDVPAEFRDLFVPIPEAAFRIDLSSTQIRDPRRDN
jgi:hypothetical protein